MDALLKGYRRFRQDVWPDQRALFEQLAAQGQKPQALIVACVDSRVDPSRIFDAAPGELLVVRNVANLIPPYVPDTTYHGTSAALEFGIRVLEIPHVLVLGHGMCGGVAALLKGDLHAKYDFISPWISLGDGARNKVMSCYDPAEYQLECEQEIVRLSLNNLLTYPWVKSKVEQGALSLGGAWFSVATGELKIADAGGEFAAI